MKPDRIRIWRLDQAPKQLRAMHTSADNAEWLAWVPRGIYGPDVERAIQQQSGGLNLSRYETPDGDVIYTGGLRKDPPSVPVGDHTTKAHHRLTRA